MPTYFARSSTLHVAIIPDGNGRWAQARGLSRPEGHRSGVEAVRRTVRAAPDLGIGRLTFHALSCDNWRRPAAEVRSILASVGSFLDSESPACLREGIRVTVVGRRDRLPPTLLRSVENAERATAAGSRLHLCVAVDYSARGAIRAAIAAATIGRPRTAQHGHHGGFGPDVDLLVRSGGEQRLGDFLLWECAYAELVFVPTPWPEFGAQDLAAAVDEFHRRHRRFGGLPAPVAAAAPVSNVARSPTSLPAR